MNAETFLANFGHIANAPEGINRLREMIYNLAVTGALSEQRDEEKDGRALLTEIREKKQHLIEAGMYKRSPKLENLRDAFNEALPKIPSSWAWARLIDVGEISPKNKTDEDTVASFAPMSAISEMHSARVTCEDRTWSAIKKGYTHFADGDVVLAKITPCFENGKAAVMANLTNGIGAGTTELHVVRPIGAVVEPEFIYVFLRSPYFKIVGEGHMTGTAGQKRLPTEYFATRPFPLPPITEQKRIVAKVDELMALCDQLEAQQQDRERRFPVLSGACHASFAEAPTPANLNRIFNETGTVSPSDIRKTILTLAVQGKLVPQDPNDEPAQELIQRVRAEKERLTEEGEIKREKQLPPIDELSTPFPLPKGWTWCRLGELTKLITSGSRGWAENYSATGPIFVRMGNLSRGSYRLRMNNVQRVDPPKDSEGLRTRLAPGDVLVSITGEVGLLGLVTPELGEAYINQHTCLVRFVGELQNRYFPELFRSPFAQQQFNAPQRGIKNSFRLSDVAMFVTPVPPLTEQLRIVAKVDQLMALIDNLEAQQRQKDKLAEAFAKAYVASFTGTNIERRAKMKAPKTELVSVVTIGNKPKPNTDAPLATLLSKRKDELPAKALWEQSGLTIEVFYQQLKSEIAQGWIAPPKEAEMKIVAEA